MIISDACISQINSPVRTIKARVELLEGSTLLNQFCYTDALISFDIQRVGEGKFFGFGICHRLNIHLRDPHRELNISTANNLDISFGAGCEYIYPFPNFHVSEVHRDENTNELSITAYDALYKATEHTVSELELDYYTIREFATACAALLGLPMKIITDDETPFNTYYENGANFDGSENLREALNAVAEATQTIYYLDSNWNLTFKRLDMDGEPVITIDKNQYIDLDSKTNRRLSRIVSATELGDDVEGVRKNYAEGNPVSVNDCAAGKPMELTIESNGETLGKNLIDYTRAKGRVSTQSVEIVENGVIWKAGGTYYFQIPVSIPAYTTVVVSWENGINDAGENINNYQFLFTDGTYSSGTNFTNGVSRTPVKDVAGIFLYKATPGTALTQDLLVSNIQVELGTTATEYVPYDNTVGPEGIEVRAGGKNLANPSIYTTDGNKSTVVYEGDGVLRHRATTTGSGGVTAETAESTTRVSATLQDLCPDIQPGKTYTLNATTTCESKKYIYLQGNYNKAWTFGASLTITEAMLTDKVLWYSLGDNVDVFISNIQIELGSTATEYEPYSGPAQTAVADAEGRVEGLVSITPTTVIEANHPNAVVKTKYLLPDMTGTTQYVRDNPFWALREDIATLVDDAAAAMYGFTIHQFDCSWRGNFLIEIGDKIALVTKDDETFYSYLLNDTINYDGAFSQKTEWQYDENESETSANPSSLGDYLNQTYARVDKQDKRIDLVASEQTTQGERLSQLQLTTDTINSTVTQLQATTSGSIDNIDAKLVELNSKIEQTADEINISINRIETADVTQVKTSTGFTFNEEGMRVAKTGSEMETVITEDGMTVYKKNKEVLVADNEGVKAIDLHATTFLIIGENSRFEDYGSDRTACFWIGG